MAAYEKPDFWSVKAQKEGYPARSVYKLKEMDEKFGLLKARIIKEKNKEKIEKRGERAKSFKVLDLGAAPGSWSLYVLRKLNGAKGFKAGGAFLCAIDLAPLSRVHDQGLFDGEGFFFIQGDMTMPENREAILSRGPYDLLISDAAPATTGNRSVDTLRSLALAETALDYAGTALDKGGHLVIKVFQGGDTAGLLRQIRQSFESAKSFKPQACRAESFETYYVGLGRK